MTDNKKKIAVIFDLDGVIVSTDELHYTAWKKLCDERCFCFDRKINDLLRGVSRRESLEIILEKNDCKSFSYSDIEKMTEIKNDYYKEMLESLTPEDILPGVNDLIKVLKNADVRIAIGSSSRNTETILRQVCLDKTFDAVADGNEIKRSKPAPDVFLLAAEKLSVEPSNSIVIEDAEAGVDAAIAAGMKSVGVGAASIYNKASLNLNSLADLKDINILLKLITE